MRQSIGNFLLRRLHEVGIRHVFGVPGDYNLEFMQQLEDRGQPVWIGTCNELNGSYAADGYARIHGLAALAVTNGVGALSAMNGIAGAYSEHVPVICICGSLPVRSLERGEMMHHTLGDGGRGNVFRAFAEMTAAQAELSPENAVVEVDRLILTAWRRKLPVYLQLPSDIGYIEIETPDDPLQLAAARSNPERLQTCADAILARLDAAKRPAFLLDLDADRFGVLGHIKRLAEKLQMPVAVLNTCKAGQAVWGSIGYTMGALLGTLCAAPKRRHILFIGDGSFQLTAQELSTILRHDFKPFIFLINNRGYTIERTILGKNARYNDIANWRYADLPSVFCREGTAECYTVETEEEFQRILDAPHKGLVFVEALMDKSDSPSTLIRGGHAFADSDFGPTGPQFVPDANIPLAKS
jgi:TPP-dependent 2-oxoacid decarboxylase